MDVDFIIRAFVVSAAIGQTLFALFYGLALPWYNSFLGRVLFGKAVTLGALTDTVAIRLWAPWLIPEQIVPWLYGSVAVATWLQFVAFVLIWLRQTPGERRMPS